MESLSIRPRHARPIVVDMAEHVRTHAAAMSDAVAAFDSVTRKEQRSVATAIRWELAMLRPSFGLRPLPTSLLSRHVPGKRATQAKLAKNELPTLALTLQSATLCRVTLPSGRRLILSTCPHMGLCGRVCVLGHGRGKWATVKAGRDWRTLALWSDPVGFAMLMRWEILEGLRRHGDMLMRPNVNSDIPWHMVAPLWAPSDDRILAYGYSKDAATLATDGYLLPTYRVTYSLNERSDMHAIRAFLERGGTVAAVTNRKRKGATMASVDIDGETFGVVDGDKSDDRFHDPRGVVVDLYAKGRAIGMSGPFVRAWY